MATASTVVAMATASLLACAPVEAFAGVRCAKPRKVEARAIRASFEHTLLRGLTGEPAAGPLFEPCVLRHVEFGRYVLLDFSAEGFYGGNNWGQFLALGRMDEHNQLMWVGGGPTGGNAPPPYQVDAVLSGKEIWIEWHAAQCVTLSYRGLAVPFGANAAFPQPTWKRVVIEHRECGQCGENTSMACVRSVLPAGTPIGEKISH